MYRISFESYPNREVRVTLTREQHKREYPPGGDTEKNAIATALPPHLSFVQNSPPIQESHQEGFTVEKGKRPGFGGLPRQQKFSVYGRRQILRAGGALEETHGYEDCLFLTLTHPGSTEASKRALAEYSGLAVQMYQRWLSKHIHSKLSIYTWEWQRRGALHLHFVVHCPDRQKGEWIIKNQRREWIRILDRITEESQTDMFRKHEGFSWASKKEIVRTDAQWCKKSVAAYLSKYVSKATQSNRAMGKKSYYPSRWYGVSRPLLQLTRELSARVVISSVRSMDAMSIYEDCLSVLQSWAIRSYEYKHVVGDGKTIIGYVEKTEKESIWNQIMTQFNNPADSLQNTEQRLRRLAQDGAFLMRKHRTWAGSFAQFCNGTHVANLLLRDSFKSMSRNDLIYLLDMLTYTFRYTQRTRFELPGECKLWYSRVHLTIEEADPQTGGWCKILKL